MDEGGSTRRSFLGRLLGSSLVVGFGGVLSAALAYLFPASEVRSGLGPQKVKVASAEDLNSAGGRLVLVDEEPVWVVPVAGAFVALSAMCTHKGCIVKWEGKRRLFVCPCHEGLFDDRGNVVSGLPRRPLAHFRAGVVRGEVFVSRSEERPSESGGA